VSLSFITFEWGGDVLIDQECPWCSNLLLCPIGHSNRIILRPLLPEPTPSLSSLLFVFARTIEISAGQALITGELDSGGYSSNERRVRSEPHNGFESSLRGMSLASSHARGKEENMADW
jgi:hypothetical protein